MSVSLSPTARNLLVGLTSRVSRMALAPRDDRSIMAQIFKIQLPSSSRKPGGGTENSPSGRNGGSNTSSSSREAAEASRGRLIHRHDIHQLESGMTSLGWDSTLLQ